MQSLMRPASRSRASATGPLSDLKVHLTGTPKSRSNSKSSKLLGLLEESAKLRQELQDIRGQFIVALDHKSRGSQRSSPAVIRTMSPRAGSPAVRCLARRAVKPASPAPLRAHKRPASVVTDKENRCPSVAELGVSSPVAQSKLEDLSQISDITQHLSFREQPSTANLDGHLHSTFNYPLHSTLNYPLNSTINFFDEPLPKYSQHHEGLTADNSLPELSLVTDKDSQVTRETPQKNHKSRRHSKSHSKAHSYSLRKHIQQQERTLSALHEVAPVFSSRYVAGCDEVDVDCDSSVLSELDDLSQEETLINDEVTVSSGSGVAYTRTLTRQTGQAVLSLHPRPPLALSQSDYYFDVSCMQTSTEATRASQVDMSSATRSSKTSRTSSSRCPPPSLVQHHEKNASSRVPPSSSHMTHPPHRTSSSKPAPLGRRVPPCGAESKDSCPSYTSAVSCSTRTSKRKQIPSTSSSSSITSHDLSRQQKKELAKKLRHFSSSVSAQGHQDSITTLGVF